VYSEQQSLPEGVVWPVALFLLLIGFGALALTVSRNGIYSGGVGVVAIILLAFFVGIFFAFAFRMKTEIKGDLLLVRMRPLKDLTLRVEDVSNVEPVSYNPISDFGGWGVRYGLGGRMYSARGDRAIKLTLKSGEVLYIGTGQPDRLSAEIRRLQ
jgi:hypothetical protein